MIYYSCFHLSALQYCLIIWKELIFNDCLLRITFKYCYINILLSITYNIVHISIWIHNLKSKVFYYDSLQLVVIGDETIKKDLQVIWRFHWGLNHRITRTYNLIMIIRNGFMIRKNRSYIDLCLYNKQTKIKKDC